MSDGETGPCMYCGADLDSYRREIDRLHAIIGHLHDGKLRLVEPAPISGGISGPVDDA